MTFFSRAATIAAITLGIAALIAPGTPSFASELGGSLDVSVAIPVPLIPSLPATARAAPAPAADTATDDAVIDNGVPVADAADYATLAAAVSAQDMPDAIPDDLRCLAGAIYFESKGEPLPGQLAVAEVILNRAKSGRFPGSVCSVVTQPGQFSFVRGGRMPSVAPGAAYRTAVAVAKVAMAGAWDNPAPDALYFHARRVAPGWHMTRIAAIGNHVFFR